MCLSCAQWVLWVTQANHSHWPHQGLQGICPWLLLFNPGPARPVRNRKAEPLEMGFFMKAPVHLSKKATQRLPWGRDVGSSTESTSSTVIQRLGGTSILGVSFFSSYKLNLDFLILFPDYKIFANAGRHFQTPLGSTMISCGQWVL